MLMLRLMFIAKGTNEKVPPFALTVLGLFALVSTKSKTQDFSISFGGVPAFYGPDYYSGGHCDPGYGYYYYHRRAYYHPAYYPGYYYGGYYRRHHRCHHWEDDD